MLIFKAPSPRPNPNTGSMFDTQTPVNVPGVGLLDNYIIMVPLDGNVPAIAGDDDMMLANRCIFDVPSYLESFELHDENLKNDIARVAELYKWISDYVQRPHEFSSLFGAPRLEIYVPCSAITKALIRPYLDYKINLPVSEVNAKELPNSVLENRNTPFSTTTFYNGITVTNLAHGCVVPSTPSVPQATCVSVPIGIIVCGTAMLDPSLTETIRRLIRGYDQGSDRDILTPNN